MMKRRNSRGGILVEMVIIAPLFFLIPLATLQIVRVLQFSQVVNEVAHSYGTEAFRQCSDFVAFTEVNGVTTIDQARVQSLTISCILSSLKDYTANLPGLLANNFAVLISVYKVNGSATVPVTLDPVVERIVAKQGSNWATTPPGKCSVNASFFLMCNVKGTNKIIFSPQSFNSPNFTKRRIVVAEVVYRYPKASIITFLSRLILPLNVAGDAYEYRETAII